VNPKETVGQLIYDLGNKQWDIPKLRELLETILPQKATFDNYEVEHDFADIGRRIMLLNARQIQRESGKERIILLSIEDITERKKIEAALHQISLELQEKNAEQERFLYTASHDLKSPVVTVRTFLTYLEQDMASAKPERIAKDIIFIRAAADKMVQLLDDLLSLSRVGRVISPPVRVTLKTMADEALAAVAGRITERGVRTRVADNNVTLYGDRLRLAEIWQNLVENACKYMGEQKEPRIEIGAETRGAEQVFFVRDNGLGIDPRFQTKIFGLFEKLDAKTEGTGIGLAVVQRIVGLYGGRIWVESAGLGQGACFYFTLPAAVNKEPKEGEKI
ncbi:MAG: ATP-binding protein, partial [Elusimicrobiota bacterium]|nr:ATP-binding protein [Elusimicrobiota bacterium]